MFDGVSVGSLDGTPDGALVGAFEGIDVVGFPVGDLVGSLDGVPDGAFVGFCDGGLVGFAVGNDGDAVGLPVKIILCTTNLIIYPCTEIFL